jgi:2-polyprenyl-3-methyl-5-hydroxy-6-metoxy-1,4-benzoquinol methylase
MKKIKTKKAINFLLENVENSYEKRRTKRIIEEYAFNFYRAKILFDLISNYFKISNYNFLEIGGGVGTISIFFALNGIKTTVIEKNKIFVAAMKKLAEENKVNIRIIEKDFFNYKKNEKYDLILCNDLFEHVKNKKKLILHIKKFLKTNGKVLINIPNRYSLVQILYEDHTNIPLFSLLPQKIRDWLGFKIYYLSKNKLKNILYENNFEINDITLKYLEILRKYDSKIVGNNKIRKLFLKIFKNVSKYKILLNQTPKYYLIAIKT